VRWFGSKTSRLARFLLRDRERNALSVVDVVARAMASSSISQPERQSKLVRASTSESRFSSLHSSSRNLTSVAIRP
jgi:hypothetical protein